MKSSALTRTAKSGKVNPAMIALSHHPTNSAYDQHSNGLSMVPQPEPAAPRYITAHEYSVPPAQLKATGSTGVFTNSLGLPLSFHVLCPASLRNTLHVLIKVRPRLTGDAFGTDSRHSEREKSSPCKKQLFSSWPAHPLRLPRSILIHCGWLGVSWRANVPAQPSVMSGSTSAVRQSSWSTWRNIALILT